MRCLVPAFMLAASLAAASLTVVLPAAAQDTASKQLAARTELHAIPTLTLSDQQFLTGDASAKPRPSPGCSASRRARASFPWWC